MASTTYAAPSPSTLPATGSGLTYGLLAFVAFACLIGLLLIKLGGRRRRQDRALRPLNDFTPDGQYRGYDR